MILHELLACAREGRLYQALKHAKTLLAHEQEILTHVPNRA